MKLSVTVEDSVAAEPREVVGPRRLSAFVNEAIQQRLQSIRLRKLLDELEEEHGPVPDDVKREVEALDWPR